MRSEVSTAKQFIMARKKQRKKGRVRTVVLFLVLPLIVWFIAFLVWFYWYDLSNLFVKKDARPVHSKPALPIDKDERRERTLSPKPQEKILDEDRKKLEDILKRRS
jgi:hypothetical protein